MIRWLQILTPLRAYATVILLAAILKAVSFEAFESALGRSPSSLLSLHPTVTAVGVILVELFIGGTLLALGRGRVLAIAGLVLVASFVCSHAYGLVPSCRCFGPLQVMWLVPAANAALFGLALYGLLAPSDGHPVPHARRRVLQRAAPLAASLLVGLSAAVAVQARDDLGTHLALEHVVANRGTSHTYLTLRIRNTSSQRITHVEAKSSCPQCMTATETTTSIEPHGCGNIEATLDRTKKPEEELGLIVRYRTSTGSMVTWLELGLEEHELE